LKAWRVLWQQKMNKLLNTDYSYGFMQFIANGVKYRLVGTKCEEYEKPNMSEDCFVDENGKFHTFVREILMVKQKEKKITPIPKSEIKINTEKKKTLRRAV